MATQALIKPPSGALAVLPDTERYKCRFQIAGSSGTIHTVSFDAAPGAMHWTCSCRGHIGHGHCRHLRAFGKEGRDGGRNMKDAKLLGVA